MTDNEIIKALECCGVKLNCAECPLKSVNPCCEKLCGSALDLINRLRPCKVGDTVWAIRRYNSGKKIAIRGKVSEMYYIDEAMTLCIVVKGVCRGVWGVSIFPTQEAAEEYLKEKEKAKNVK